jgi:DNA-binding XRE family transcriptional regulator
MTTARLTQTRAQTKTFNQAVTKPKQGKANTTPITDGPALVAWRKQVGITQKVFAEMADFSERTMASCENDAKVLTKLQRPINETVRLTNALSELAGDSKSLKSWLHQPNPAFGGKPPMQMIKNGESDRLWEMVHQIRQGAFA